MSKRNMSERANCGLMLCQGLTPIDGSTIRPGYVSGPGESPIPSLRDENRRLAALNNLVPGGVADQNKFRPLAQLLENIGESNEDGITPIDIDNLSPESVKLFKNFMAEAGVPTTGESPKRAEVLNTMQKTFGLSDMQVTGLLFKSLNGQNSLRDEDGFTPSSQETLSPQEVELSIRDRSLQLWREQNAKDQSDPKAVIQEVLRSNGLASNQPW